MTFAAPLLLMFTLALATTTMHYIKLIAVNKQVKRLTKAHTLKQSTWHCMPAMLSKHSALWYRLPQVLQW
jgi:hypothetical protein